MLDKFEDALAALNCECSRTSLDVAKDYLRELKRERDESLSECIEQARLLGMGAAREARLIAERDALLGLIRFALAQHVHTDMIEAMIREALEGK